MFHQRTLVGAGLRPKTDFRRPLDSLIPKHITLIPENVQSFSPTTSSVTTTSGRQLSYDALVVAAGLQINWNGIRGLTSALADPTSGVSSIYSYATCDKVWDDVEGLRSGNAIFTQPAGIIKCAGGESLSFISGSLPQPSKQRPRKLCGWLGTDTGRQVAPITSM
jgi:NADPH-dependent 2,4-dienoyl-CoA reductase/sulfur reductase-like enzyme